MIHGSARIRSTCCLHEVSAVRPGALRTHAAGFGSTRPFVASGRLVTVPEHRIGGRRRRPPEPPAHRPREAGGDGGAEPYSFRMFDAVDFVAELCGWIPDKWRRETIASGGYANVVRGNRARGGEGVEVVNPSCQTRQVGLASFDQAHLRGRPADVPHMWLSNVHREHPQRSGRSRA